MSGKTVVEYFSDHEKYKCGYCGSKDTNYSHGMWAHSMTVKDYQELIDRGWRRSGCYVYKPSMDQTCCPQYTIKCNALDFKLSRSQKKAIKKVNKFLNTGEKPGVKDGSQAVDMESEVKECIPDKIQASDVGSDNIDMSRLSSKQTVINTDSKHVKSSHVKLSAASTNVNPSGGSDVKPKTNVTNCDSGVVVSKKSPRQGQGADPSKPKCVKAKVRRQQAWQQKHPHAQPSKKDAQEAKSLEDRLNDLDPKPAHKLELRLVRSHPKTDVFEETFSQTHTMYKAYQISIHKDPPEKPSLSQFTRFLCNSPLKVRLTRRNQTDSREFEARFVDSYNLYRKYQMDVHKDAPEDCEIKGYTRFLVDSPLKAESTDGGFPQGFGSFHQQYLLDGQLIAVGVIDILPHCVSSVYLYYDPEYNFLSLGTYSALREVAFTRHLHTMEPELKFYYMGFYIHTCPKMRYKGGYEPSFLACPETYGWFPIEECTSKLDANKYSRFAPPDQVDPECDLELSEFLVLFSRQAMPYSVYSMLNSEAGDEEEVRQYGGFVGNTLAKRILLYRS